MGCPLLPTTWSVSLEAMLIDNLLPRLRRRLEQVDGRGACRHPDGAVALVRSALTVFAVDVASHSAGAPCSHHRRPTSMRLPVSIPF